MVIASAKHWSIWREGSATLLGLLVVVGVALALPEALLQGVARGRDSGVDQWELESSRCSGGSVSGWISICAATHGAELVPLMGRVAL